VIYHVLNRGVGRRSLFDKPDDYAAFLRVMVQAQARHPIRLLAFCLMPNHWHLLLWPKRDGELSTHLHWLTLTHTQRLHAHHHTMGTGHIYQGRFKSFPVAEDDHFLRVARYVEGNAWRADLVTAASEWRWGSLWQRRHGDEEVGAMLSPWPVAKPRRWDDLLTTPQGETELAEVRRSVVRGAPFGEEEWRTRVAEELGLTSTLRPKGRPRCVR